MVSAVGMSRIPQPVSLSNPCGPTSRADQRIKSKICELSSIGRAVHTHAVAPETIGAEKLVPSRVLKPVASNESGTAAGMSTPGAERSTPGEELEKAVVVSCSSVAATVRTCDMLAGKLIGLPWSFEFPDAATMIEPRLMTE